MSARVGKVSGCISLAGWNIDLVSGELRQGDRRQRLGPKTTAVLACLAERAGEVVSKEELLARVWPKVAVTDYVLWTCISELRRALGTRTRSSRTLETLPRRGYRLTTEVVTHGSLGSSQPKPQPGPGSDLATKRARPFFGSSDLGEAGPASPYWLLAMLAGAIAAGFWLAARSRSR